MKILMTEKEIMDGLKKARENNPNATVGNAVEQMMGLDLFWRDKFQTEGNIVSANIPQCCLYTVKDVADVIGYIDNMVLERKISLLGEDINYGKPTDHDLKRLSAPGAISPILGSDITTWQLLSNHFEVTNL